MADVISALGAGSGMDVKALANSLVEVERAPKKSILDKKIKDAQNGISGYAAIKFVLSSLKTALTDLKDQSSFNTQSPRNSQPNAIAITASGTAASGTHNITVTKLATAQKRISDGFANNNASLNNGASFDLTLSVNGGSAETITVPSTNDTPRGIVAAINASGKGIKAQLINTGEASNPYKIVLTGATGASQDFTLTSDLSTVNFDTSIQNSSNGLVNIDGVSLQPSSNTMSGVVPGMTLDFLTPTVGSASFEVARDKSSIQAKLEALVTAYNDASTVLASVADPKSTDPGYGASLVGNSTVNTVKAQLRALITTDSNSPSGGMSNLRDIGVNIDRYGKMSLDKGLLDKALTSNFEDVVTLMTNNQENLSTFSPTKAGAAGESVKKLAAMIASTGTLTAQSANLTKQITGYNDELSKLEIRMTALLTRYNKQFGAMENIVGQSKSTRSGLTSTFDGMMATYTKN